MAPAKSLQVIASFPPGYFLENITTLKDDTLLVTVPNRQSLYCLPPSLSPSSPRCPILLHKFDTDQWTMGLANQTNNPNVVYLVTTDFTSTGRCESHLHYLDFENVASGGDPMPLFRFPSNAKGLNGLCQLSENVLLAADSFESVIWRIDLDLSPQGVPKSAKASEWMRHAEFAGKLVLPDFQPGVNGLKYSDKTSSVCFSNSQHRTFGRITVERWTLKAIGEPVILAKGMQGDDLLIDDDFADGPVAYLTTHRDNTIVRIPLSDRESGDASERSVVVIAKGSMEEDIVLGPTAGVWSMGAKGKIGYFTCDGGLKHQLEDGLVRWARVVRVEF